MRFNLRRPCPRCPFRTDVAPYLRRGRVEALAAQLLGDDHQWFGCHETTAYDDARGDMACTADTQHCFGAAVLLWKEGRPNIATRLALATGRLPLAHLERAAATLPIYPSFAAMAAAQDG